MLVSLRGNLDSTSCQDVLITGERGTGKTMLLTRLEAELRRDPKLATMLLPMHLPETI